MELITSRANPRVRALAELRQSKHRQAQSLTLAEGLHLVVGAFASPVSIASLVVAERAFAHPDLPALEQQARARSVDILRLSDSCYDKITALDSPDGLAVTIRAAAVPLESLLTVTARLLVAAGVQDPGNAGALVRTAEAAGATGCIFLAGVDLSHPRFLRGAQASSFRLPCVSTSEADFLAALKSSPIRLLVADPRKAADYRAADYTPPLAIVVGAEGQGVPPSLLAAADARVSIPMKPPVESLNVAVAAGVLLYQARLHWPM